MRTALVLLVGLLLVGVWLGHCDGEPLGDRADSADALKSGELPWVRTVDGWERATWLAPKAGYAPRLHPLVVALFVVMSSTIGLLAFSSDDPSSAEE